MARAKLGLPQIELNGVPRGRGGERLEIVRAVQLLYALDEREIAIPIFADIGENGDPDALAGLGELASRNNDARAMLLLGKAALNRGLPFDHYAYPLVGIPPFKSVGPEVERSVVYAIARQESAFNPAVVSPANAYGLMQVTPDAGRYVCRRHGCTFDLTRLKSDPVYNAALGAAELGGLLEDYRGSYIMTFAGYNAGRGSVQEMGRALRRPARSQGRRDRLGRTDSVLRNPQLRAADHGEPAGLPRPLRRRHRSCRSRPTCAAARSVE